MIEALSSVNEEHPKFWLFSCLKTSIHHVLKHYSQRIKYENVTAKHYKMKYKENFELINGLHGMVFGYAPHIFSILRREFGIDDSSFVKSCCLHEYSYWYLCTPSTSNIYQTHDQRYVIKVAKRREMHVFLRILSGYVKHFIRYPHSLLVKVVGLYQVRTQSFRNVNSVPVKYINTDKQFAGQKIRLGHNMGRWFVDQIQCDVDFLQSQSLIGYGILLGIQPLIRKRIAFHKSQMQAQLMQTFSNKSCSVQSSSKCRKLQKNICTKIGVPHDNIWLNEEQWEDKTCPLRLIDGQTHRYYTAITSIFTSFSATTKTHHILKSLRHHCRDRSLVPPSVYKAQFMKLIRNSVCM